MDQILHKKTFKFLNNLVYPPNESEIEKFVPLTYIGKERSEKV